MKRAVESETGKAGDRCERERADGKRTADAPSGALNNEKQADKNDETDGNVEGDREPVREGRAVVLGALRDAWVRRGASARVSAATDDHTLY